MIRNWFGSEVSYQPTIENGLLDQLLQCYKEVFLRYLSVEDQESIEDTIVVALTTPLTFGQTLFLNWMNEKEGLARIKFVATMNLIDQEKLIAELNYEIYSVNEEKQGIEDLSEMRSCLINLTVHLFEIYLVLHDLSKMSRG